MGLGLGELVLGLLLQILDLSVQASAAGGELLDFLMVLRKGYFELVSFAWDREGIEEYIEYKAVCDELLALASEGCWVHQGAVDLEGFGRSAGAKADSKRIRAQIAAVGNM